MDSGLEIRSDVTRSCLQAAFTQQGPFINEWGQKTLKRITIDPLGNQTEEIFDANINLIKVTKTDKSGILLAETESYYDRLGNQVIEKTAVISSGVPSRTYETKRSFNAEGQLESFTFGKTPTHERSYRFEYNVYGDRSAKYIPGSEDPLAYRYDYQGNLDTVSYKEGEKEIFHRLSYDHTGNLNHVCLESVFAIDYSFDANNQVLSEKIEDDFGSYQISCVYDGEGKIEILCLPDGSFVKYSYEGPFVKAAKRFSKDKKEIYNYQVVLRDQMGNILEEILPGNLGERKQFWDKAGRRTEIFTKYFQDKVLKEGYDPLDNLKKRETTLDGKTLSTVYDYDTHSNLVVEKKEKECTYSYDSIGNRLKKNSSAYKVDELNQLIEAEGIYYSFNQNGNLATKTKGSKFWNFQSNPLNQIVSITDSDQNTIRFHYDLSGKRVVKRIEAKGKKPKTLRFFYLGTTEIGCLDEKGVIAELKIPSDPNHPEFPCIAIEIKQEIYVPLYDLQGNIACVLDPQKLTVIESYSYSAYGEEKITDDRKKVVSDSSIGNPWRYRGKRIDKETGLIYFGCRFYSPEIGRWISPDPLGAIDSPNLYVYARNNPMNYIDYFGLASEVNENQSCICGPCERGEGLCHCLLSIDYPECNCTGVFCNHKGSRSIVSVGNKITSALGGIGHGVLDFMIGSLHDLQTAAVYMGSGELEMSLHERVLMIEAVEKSQANQMAKVEGWMMDMPSVDQSDTLYQSFQSKTTLGLEVGSLVAGGYGAVKGVIGFSKLARTPAQIGKTAKAISRIPSNPLQGAKYTRKVLLQMENNLKTGKPDFHGFPQIVDNYAGLGKTELIKGKDGLTRLKISVEGGYKGQDGYFEWILESDKSVNHRIFIRNP